MILFWLIPLVLLGQIRSDGFVEEVACSAASLTVVLNRSDPDVARWMSDPKAQPVVYVYGHKTLVPCGTSLKNDKGQQNYNLTIPYGKHCDVLLTDLEPNYRTAETTIAFEDNMDTSLSKVTRINHVFCLYTRSVQTIRYSDVATGHEVVASTGGKPKPKVEMMFRSTDGRPLRTAKFGDTVEFYVALSPDKAYHGISPKECMFSDREDMLSPDAQHLTFVQSSCPVHGMSEIIDPLANVNEEVYFSKFKTFRFGNQSTVFAQCTVQVCLDSSECAQNCFKRVPNSNLTAERLRFRHRRTAGLPYSKNDVYDEVSIRESLTILDDFETKELSSRSTEQCLVSPMTIPTHVIVAFCILSALCLISISAAVYLTFRIRKGKKESFDVYSAYSSSISALGTVTSGPIGYGGHSRQAYAHHLEDNYR